MDLTSMRVLAVACVRELHFDMGGQRVMTWDARDWERTDDLLAARLAEPGGVLPVSLAPYHTFGIGVVWDDDALERLSISTVEPVRREEIEYGDIEEYLDEEDGEIKSGRSVCRRWVDTDETKVVWAPVEVQTPRLEFGTTPSSDEVNDVNVPVWQRCDRDHWATTRCDVRADADGTSWWFKNVLRFTSGMAGLWYSA
jgi:hypothetical protein